MSERDFIIGGSVEQQVRDLASGTLASLSGWSDYDRVYQLRFVFLEFVRERASEFRTWQAAWHAFWPGFEGNPAVLRVAVAKFSDAEGLQVLEAASVLQGAAAKLELANPGDALVRAQCELVIAGLADLKRQFIRVSRPDLADLLED